MLITCSLDNKSVTYDNKSTEFLIQVGKGKKGSYKIKYRIFGDLRMALLLYSGVNIGNGYKKRLFVPEFDKNKTLLVARS